MSGEYKYFVEFTVSANDVFQSWGDFSNEIRHPEFFISDCSRILSKYKGKKEYVEYLFEDRFDDPKDCFLMYTYGSMQSVDSVYVKYYNYNEE